MKHKIYGSELKNMPYEPRPEGCDSPLWRYSKNPIIGMNPFPNASRVFNSAVMAYQGEFIGVFRLILLSKKNQSFSTIKTTNLLNQNMPMIHAQWNQKAITMLFSVLLYTVQHQALAKQKISKILN